MTANEWKRTANEWKRMGNEGGKDKAGEIDEEGNVHGTARFVGFAGFVGVEATMGPVGGRAAICPVSSGSSGRGVTAIRANEGAGWGEVEWGSDLDSEEPLILYVDREAVE